MHFQANWHKANAYCHSLGRSLITIQSQQEYLDVTEIIRNAGTSNDQFRTASLVKEKWTRSSNPHNCIWITAKSTPFQDSTTKTSGWVDLFWVTRLTTGTATTRASASPIGHQTNQTTQWDLRAVHCSGPVPTIAGTTPIATTATPWLCANEYYRHATANDEIGQNLAWMYSNEHILIKKIK